MERFEHLVIGGGPMGAATARHLAAAGQRVMLLAPRDPLVSWSEHAVPSSHADHSRVTRRLDRDITWARLASASVARYRDLEQRSRVPFFHETGCLTIVEGADERAVTRLAEFSRVGEALDVEYERLEGAGIHARYPSLRLPARSTVLAETQGAGWLDPRAYVQAQIAVGRAHGLAITEEPMAHVTERSERVEVATRSGELLHGEHAIFAMGPYSAFDLPTPARQPLVVYARTVVHVRLTAAQREALGALPSMIVRGLTDAENVYILPPAQYPDGHWYIKIGGGMRTHRISARADLEEWFAGPGDPAIGEALTERLHRLLPATEGGSSSTQACAITVAEGGLPTISRLSERTTLVTGGNGHAAKSGDEIGRLAAGMVLGRQDWSAGYESEAF